VPCLFVGIDFPFELKVGLSKLCAGVPGARWVEPCKFHLTLRFIGAVDQLMATDISVALLRIEAPRFALTLAGVGHFSGHTLWLGVEEIPALMCLQGRVENELQQIRLPADGRPYVPHVKRAHLRRRRSLRAFLGGNADFRAESFEVTCFNLIESHPRASGAVYQRKADYALR
jgi:RNA 2',3'-cyclic 3'-phosphodiesterase